MYGIDPDDAGGNMRVLRTRDDAEEASLIARTRFEHQYKASVHIDLDPRVADKWWPLTAQSRT